jgi:MFS family permease
VPSATQPILSSEASERRLVLVFSAVVFVDTMFYAVIAPLLPGLVTELHLSKLSAGVLTASYAIGTLVGSLPGGMLAVRGGPRFTVCTGLWLLAVSTVAFGFLHNVVALDAARFVEGTGGACSWAGGLGGWGAGGLGGWGAGGLGGWGAGGLGGWGAGLDRRRDGRAAARRFARRPWRPGCGWWRCPRSPRE